MIFLGFRLVFLSLVWGGKIDGYFDEFEWFFCNPCVVCLPLGIFLRWRRVVARFSHELQGVVGIFSGRPGEEQVNHHCKTMGFQAPIYALAIHLVNRGEHRWTQLSQWNVPRMVGSCLIMRLIAAYSIRTHYGWSLFSANQYWLVVWNIFHFPIYWGGCYNLSFIFLEWVAHPPTRVVLEAWQQVLNTASLAWIFVWLEWSMDPWKRNHDSMATQKIEVQFPVSMVSEYISP